MANNIVFSFSHLCYPCTLHHFTAAISIPVSVKKRTTIFNNHFAALPWKPYRKRCTLSDRSQTPTQIAVSTTERPFAWQYQGSPSMLLMLLSSGLGFFACLFGFGFGFGFVCLFCWLVFWVWVGFGAFFSVESNSKSHLLLSVK